MLSKNYQQKSQPWKQGKLLTNLFLIMEEKTADEIAEIFSAAGDSVTVIGTAQTSDETDADFKDKIKRNVDHLEIIKDYKKLDGTTSIWTSEDFTAIDAAIVAGKKLY